MDQITLVKKDAGEQFVSEFGKIFPIKAAFWLKITDQTLWYLYVTSEQFNTANRQAAYAEVFRAVKQVQDAYFDPFWVKLVNPDEPLVEAVTAIQDRHRGPFPIEYNDPQLGGFGIDGAYIYPSPVAVS